MLDVRFVLNFGKLSSSTLTSYQLGEHDSVILGFPLLLVFNIDLVSCVLLGKHQLVCYSLLSDLMTHFFARGDLRHLRDLFQVSLGRLGLLTDDQELVLWRWASMLGHRIK